MKRMNEAKRMTFSWIIILLIPFITTSRSTSFPVLVDAWTIRSTPTDRISTTKISNQLVEKLLQQQQQQSGQGYSTKEEQELKEEISSLANSLIEQRVAFDPNQSLNGLLYVSQVLDGPEPFWKKLGVPFNSIPKQLVRTKKNDSDSDNSNNSSGRQRRNIQGQQYTYSDGDDDSNKETNGNSVINYAEIFGPGTSLSHWNIHRLFVVVVVVVICQSNHCCSFWIEQFLFVATLQVLVGNGVKAYILSPLRYMCIMPDDVLFLLICVSLFSSLLW